MMKEETRSTADKDHAQSVAGPGASLVAVHSPFINHPSSFILHPV